MTTPHLHPGPPPRDAEALHAWLESITGTMPLPAGSNGHDPHAAIPERGGALVATARSFHHAIESAERTSAPAPQRQELWERIMQQTAIAGDGFTTGGRPPIRGVTGRGRTRVLRIISGSQPLVTAALAAGLVIAIIAAFAWLDRGANPPPVPTEGPERNPALAASPPATTIERSPLDTAVCDVEPLSADERQAIIAAEQERAASGLPPDPNVYVPAVPAAVGVSTAADLAELEFTWQSCNQLERTAQRQRVESSRMVAAGDAATGFDMDSSDDLAQFDALRPLSEAMLSGAWRDYYLPFPDEWTNADGEAEQPLDIVNSWLLTDQLIALEDGRIAGPIPSYVPPMMIDSFETEPILFVNAHVYVADETTGTWLVDEQLSLCIMGCDQYRAELVDQAGNSDAPATPTPAPELRTYEGITADECIVEPRSDAQLAGFREARPAGEPRSYEPSGDGNPSLANDIAMVDRVWQSCNVYGSIAQRNAIESPRLTVEGPGRAFETLPASEQVVELDRTQALGDAIGPYIWQDFIGLFAEYPVDAAGNASYPFDQVGMVVLPERAVMLADGRVAAPVIRLEVPGSYGNYEDPESRTYLVIEVHVYAQDETQGGTWVLDEPLSVCVGDCDLLRQELLAVPQNPGDNPTPVSTPDATPDATPASAEHSGEGWLVDPEAVPCMVTSVEDYPEEWTVDQWVEGPLAYLPFAEAAAEQQDMAARIHQDSLACGDELGYGKPSPRAASDIRRVSPGDAAISPEELELFQSISAALPDQLPLAYVVEGPVQEAEPNSASAVAYPVLLPNDVVQLADGRLGAVQRKVLIRTEGSNLSALTLYRQTIDLNFVVFDVDDGGRWVISELLPVCIGACDDFWAQFPLTTESTPVPALETGWLADPVAVPCTVTSVESWPENWTEDAWTDQAAAYLPFGVATADDQRMAAEIRLAFDACTSGVDANTATPLIASDSPLLSAPNAEVEAARMRDGQEISAALAGADPLASGPIVFRGHRSEPVRAAP